MRAALCNECLELGGTRGRTPGSPGGRAARSPQAKEMASLATLDGLYNLVGCATAPSPDPLTSPLRAANANTELPSQSTAYEAYLTTGGCTDSYR